MESKQLCRWHEFKCVNDLEQAALLYIMAAGAQALDARGAFHIVLAGGNTPRNIYRALCSAATEWQAWHVYFGDERCAPVDDPARNSAMACNAWLDHVTIPPDQIHIIPAESGPETAASIYTKELAQAGSFDLVLLGLGEDGHTASLFPGADWERAATWPAAIPVHNAPKPPPERVTLSPARLSDASQVLFLVSGPDKQQAVTNWRTGAALPASRIRPAAGVDVFMHLGISPTARE